MPSPQSRPKAILCADDYAISAGVSRAILRLIDAGRLSAVSAIASAPAWPELAGELARRRGGVAIGLHLDLTLRPFAGARRPFAPRELAVAAFRRRLDVEALAAEFERQIDGFEQTLGAVPDHIDGHHHVHALPQVRNALLAALRRRYGGRSAALRPLVRDPGDAVARLMRRRGARGKALAVAAMAAGFGARTRAAGFATNRGFAGFSRFAGRAAFERELGEFFKAPGPRPLIMCHPGFSDSVLARLDPVHETRECEYAALMEREDIAAAIWRVRRDAGAAGSAFAMNAGGRDDVAAP